jgi:hypothetical protein
VSERLDGDLYRIATMLSEDLGRELEERATQALDKYLSQRDLRKIVIRHLMERARGIARYRASQAEEAATEQRRLREQDERISVRDVARVERIAGHVGSKNPGSTSKRNKCNNCIECKESWASWDTWEAEHEVKHSQKMRAIFDDYENTIRREMFVKWTKLLGVEIAMPSGERTTWGKATLEQHHLRHEMLTQNAMLNAENAARHAEAISVLEKTGAMNLMEAILVDQ